MRVLICGTRKRLELSQQKHVWETLDKLLERARSNGGDFDLLIHGGAHGVDYCAHRWAQNHGVQTANFYISKSVWNRTGKKAGPLRNRMMLDLNPDIVIAFPGDVGTADMCKAAEQRGHEPVKHEWRWA